MLRPTYFVGIGKFGAKVLDMIRLLCYVTTRDSTFWGLFRYHRVYWDAEEPGFGFRNLLKEPGTEATSRYTPPEAAPGDRAGVQAAIEKMAKQPNPPTPVPDLKLWKAINTGEPEKFQGMLTRLQGGLGLQEVPLSKRPEVFLIGDLSELPTSVLVPHIARQVSGAGSPTWKPGIPPGNSGKMPHIARQVSGAGSPTLPYGLLFLPGDGGDGATYARSFLYELYTSYAPGGTPLFEAVYLAHRPNLGPNDKAQAYTAARFLLLLQTVVDVPGKLVDVDSDEGRGNVLAWALRGIRFIGKEQVFQVALRTLHQFLGNWTTPAPAPSEAKEEAEALLDRMIQRALWRDPTLNKQNLPATEDGVDLGSDKDLEQILLELLWESMFRSEAPSGPAYARVLLDKMKAKTAEYLAVDDGGNGNGVPARGLWENWNPQSPIDPGVAAFARLNRQIVPLRSIGLAEAVQEQLTSGYRTYLAVGKWLQSGVRRNGDFQGIQPTLAAILGTLNGWHNELGNAIGEIGNALDADGSVWVNRGPAEGTPGVDSQVVADPQKVATLTLGPKAEGEPRVSLGSPANPVSMRWQFLTDPAKVLLEPFQKLYEGLGGVAPAVVPPLGPIAGGLATPFLNLMAGAVPQTLYNGWILVPQGAAGNALPLPPLSSQIYRRLFPHSFDFVFIQTGIGLSDISLGGGFGQVILVMDNAENQRLHRFLKLFVVASFVPVWGKALGAPRLGAVVPPDGIGDGGIWVINGAGISLQMPGDGGAPVPVFTLPAAPASPGNLLGGIAPPITSALRSFIYNTLVPLIQGDANLDVHLKAVLGDAGGMGLSELGAYVQKEVFGLPFAPTDLDHLVKGVKKFLKL